MNEARLVHSTSADRTRDAEEIASLRPVTVAKGPRSRPARRPTEVANGIVCFCGQRFTEAQALAFMLHLRAEVGEVLEWRAEVRRRGREYQRNRRATDPDWVEQKKANDRARYQDPEVAEHAKAAARERYRQLAQDPEWREQKNQRHRTPEARARSRERERARKVADPEYVIRRREQSRDWKLRHKPEPKECACGCGGLTAGGRYLQGHNRRVPSGKQS